MVGSHHDGPWSSAVEDASGISLVLAQATYWAAQPVSRRPHRLVFLLQGGHMSGGAGLLGYIDRHADELDDVVLEVHLEHAALECEVVDGEAVVTDQPTPRSVLHQPHPLVGGGGGRGHRGRGAVAVPDLGPGRLRHLPAHLRCRLPRGRGAGGQRPRCALYLFEMDTLGQ